MEGGDSRAREDQGCKKRQKIEAAQNLIKKDGLSIR